jgi:hypothetical protein
MTASVSSTAVTSSNAPRPWLMARATWRASLCARASGDTRRSFDRSVHLDPAFPACHPRPKRTWFEPSAGIDAPIPALPCSPSACPSNQVCTWMQRSPRIPPWKCTHRSSPRACPSIQVRVSFDPSARVPQAIPASRWSKGVLRTLSYLILSRSVSSPGSWPVRRRRAAAPISPDDTFEGSCRWRGGRSGRSWKGPRSRRRTRPR